MQISRARRAAPRAPHPDSRVEARLQQVLSRYATVRRAEARLSDITRQQEKVDEEERAYAGLNEVVKNLREQGGHLRAERLELEALISAAHKEIAEVLTSLGDDALYLGTVS